MSNLKKRVFPNENWNLDNGKIKEGIILEEYFTITGKPAEYLIHTIKGKMIINPEEIDIEGNEKEKN